MPYLWKTQLQLINVSSYLFRVTYFLSRFFFLTYSDKGLHGRRDLLVCIDCPFLIISLYWIGASQPQQLPLWRELDLPSILLLPPPIFRLELNWMFCRNQTCVFSNLYARWQELISLWKLSNCHRVTSVSLRWLKTEQFGETTGWSKCTVGR